MGYANATPRPHRRKRKSNRTAVPRARVCVGKHAFFFETFVFRSGRRLLFAGRREQWPLGDRLIVRKSVYCRRRYGKNDYERISKTRAAPPSVISRGGNGESFRTDTNIGTRLRRRRTRKLRTFITFSRRRLSTEFGRGPKVQGKRAHLIRPKPSAGKCSK